MELRDPRDRGHIVVRLREHGGRRLYEGSLRCGLHLQQFVQWETGCRSTVSASIALVSHLSTSISRSFMKLHEASGNGRSLTWIQESGTATSKFDLQVIRVFQELISKCRYVSIVVFLWFTLLG